MHSADQCGCRVPFSELLTSSFRPFNLPPRSPGYCGRMREPQADSARLVCECGHAVRCSVGYEGERLGSLRFFHLPELGETHARLVTTCPGCGARLDSRLLVEALSALASH